MDTHYYVMFGYHPKENKMQIATMEHHGDGLDNEHILKRAIRNGVLARADAKYVTLISEVSGPLTFNQSMEFPVIYQKLLEKTNAIEEEYKDFDKTRRVILMVGIKQSEVAACANGECNMSMLQIIVPFAKQLPGREMLTIALSEALHQRAISIETLNDYRISFELEDFIEDEDELRQKFGELMEEEF